MTWIKKNLMLVVGGIIALILMGGSAFFLYANFEKNKEAGEALDVQIAEFTRLQAFEGQPEDPKTGALAELKAQESRLRDLTNDLRRSFPAYTPPTKMDESSFKTFLESTIANLTIRATNSGVVLPPNYGFTFQPQRKLLTFAPGSIEAWLLQLSELNGLCDVLYNAKVSGIEAIRRIRVSRDDEGVSDYLGMPGITNGPVIGIPYEIIFRGFSSELAGVLDGMIRSSNFFVVKMVNVEPSRYVAPAVAAPTTTAASGAPRPGQPAAPRRTADQLMRDRYGVDPGRPRAYPSAVVNPIAGAQTNTTPVTVIAESPLRIVMLVESLRPRPPK